MRSVVGIDPSMRATGIAYAHGALATVGGEASEGRRRLLRISESVIQAAAYAELVVIEFLPGDVKGSSYVNQVLGALFVGLMHTETPFVLMNPASLKKFATGDGHADKLTMRAAWLTRTGQLVKDHNQVDAAWLRTAGLFLLDEPPFELPAEQLESLGTIEIGHIPANVGIQIGRQ